MNAFSYSEAEFMVSRDATVRYQMQPLLDFLNRPGITEVCINRPGEVFYELGSRWEREEAPHLDLPWLRSLAVAVAAFTENDVSETRPILSAVLPEGERCQFVLHPACEAETISLTIRKPSKAIIDFDDYEGMNYYAHVKDVGQIPDSEDLDDDERALIELYNAKAFHQFMAQAVAYEKNIIIVGETGSGKTTYMKSMMQLIPKEQRIITIEDVPELFLPNHPNHVHLFYPSDSVANPDAIVNPAKLLRSCLRMKPSRILLAELRGGEAYDYIDVCASGHGGSITSAHAGSAYLTFQRLASMVRSDPKSAMTPHDVLMDQLYSVIDVVGVIHNDTSRGKGRHFKEIWFNPHKKREIGSRQ